MRISLNGAAIRSLENDEGLADQLEPAADQILSRARGKTPSWVQAKFYTRSGVGPQGAFAQAIGRGSGIVLAEYGGSRSPAHAMFRSSI